MPPKNLFYGSDNGNIVYTICQNIKRNELQSENRFELMFKRLFYRSIEDRESRESVIFFKYKSFCGTFRAKGK